MSMHNIYKDDDRDEACGRLVDLKPKHSHFLTLVMITAALGIGLALAIAGTLLMVFIPN
jgi:hypothetical protein